MSTDPASSRDPTSSRQKSFDPRSLAIAAAGFSAFINLYSPQALLPELGREFGVSAGEISSLMTAGTAAIALTAPFTGALADVLGRKRLITAAMFAVVVPTVIMATVSSVPELAFWRFVQGMLLPPIFTVAVAYIGDEWPAHDVARIAGLYISGSSVGGFSGRFFTGAIADLFGWRASFAFIAVVTLAAAMLVALMLPPERSFVRSGGLGASLLQMLRHFRDPRLVATYAIGFGVLFNFIATFTYVSFHLAAPPYLFSSTLLGALFFTYLAGSAVVPWAGRAIALFGRRRLRAWHHCGVDCRRAAVARRTGRRDHYRADAVRRMRHAVPGHLHRLCHDDGQGGALVGRRPLLVDLLHRRQRGGISPGLAWNAAGWGGCVAAIIAMQAIMAVIVALRVGTIGLGTKTT